MAKAKPDTNHVSIITDTSLDHITHELNKSEDVSLKMLYGSFKRNLFRLTDTTDRSLAVVHRGVIVADESNKLWAVTALAAKRKEAATALLELQSET